MQPALAAQSGSGNPNENCNGNGNHNGHGNCGGTGLLVTIAARECDSYQDIRANLARNNIMETLQDLGADTLYQSGEPVDPRKEIQGQPTCRPITGWRFTAGSSYQSRAVSGPWGSLSIVTNPDEKSIVTEASTSLLGFQGEPIPNRVIRGATTIELGAAAAERAGRNQLWLQGGTPADPMLYDEPQFAGKYGFGALRCAIDGLNGDNVETIQFPSGVTHVFCYAYYVTPPPSSGTIIIRKETQGAGSASETFHFGGNLSYNEGGAFDLSASDGNPGSTTFYRAETRPGDAPWTVKEDVPRGWKLTEINCSANGSQVSKSVAGAKLEISLAAADTVTCTYVDKLTPPAGAVLIRKISEGGVGSFGFKILDAQGKVVKETNLKTTREGIAANSAPIKLDPGQYRVVEHSRSDRRGEWRLVDAACNGAKDSSSQSPALTITAGGGAVCTFTNRLAYPGRLTIEKVTLGGTGTAAFTISPLADPAIQRHQVAVVKKTSEAVRARGDSTRDLPFGTYVIQESGGQAQETAGWSLITVLCNGEVVPFDQGRASVRITRRAPEVNCRFVNLFAPRLAAATPPARIPPSRNPVPGGSEPDLAVEKELVQETGGATPLLTFRMTVTNRAKVAATNVVVIDSPGRSIAIVSARPGQGRCLRLKQLVCTLGTIEAGAKSIVTVEARSYTTTPTVNEAVVGSGSPDAQASNNQASVRIPRRHQPRAVEPGGSACSSAVSASNVFC